MCEIWLVNERKKILVVFTREDGEAGKEYKCESMLLRTIGKERPLKYSIKHDMQLLTHIFHQVRIQKLIFWFLPA